MVTRERAGADVETESDGPQPSRRGTTHWPEYLSGVMGLFWILWNGGTAIANPHESKWLMCGDWAWHHLGWLFCQQDRWRFPLGVVGNYPTRSARSPPTPTRYPG